MQKGSLFTLVVLIASFVVSWLLVRHTSMFTWELYASVVVIILSIIGLIAVHVSSNSWLLFVLVYGAFLLNTALIYWKFGGRKLFIGLALLVPFIGLVHAVAKVGSRDTLSEPAPEPEVYDTEAVKAAKNSEKKTAKKRSKKKK